MKMTKIGGGKKVENMSDKIRAKIKKIDAVSQDMPSVIIIHNIKTQSVEYMSERGLRILNTSMKEIRNLGPSYFEKFFNPEDAPNYTPIFFGNARKK